MLSRNVESSQSLKQKSLTLLSLIAMHPHSVSAGVLYDEGVRAGIPRRNAQTILSVLRGTGIVMGDKQFFVDSNFFSLCQLLDVKRNLLCEKLKKVIRLVSLIELNRKRSVRRIIHLPCMFLCFRSGEGEICQTLSGLAANLTVPHAPEFIGCWTVLEKLISVPEDKIINLLELLLRAKNPMTILSQL